MLKYACFLTGDNYKLVSIDTPGSKKKIVAMGLAMMVPVLIWVFNGFMLSYQVINSGIGWAILTAAVCGGIVFIIEKLIIMAKGNGWLSFFRLSIGFVIALLGSIAIDEVVFKGDIDTSVSLIKDSVVQQAKKKEEQEFKRIHDYQNLGNNIAVAQVKYDNALAATLAEADGTTGTKTKGVGGITKLKERKTIDRKLELNNLLAKKALLDSAKVKSINIAAITAGEKFNENGLLIRIQALFQLVSENKYMFRIYILFTLLIFFFEFLVVILKLTWQKTNYERKLEMIEEIGRRRMEFLQQKNSPLSDPGHYLPELESARAAIKKSSPIYN